MLDAERMLPLKMKFTNYFISQLVCQCATVQPQKPLVFTEICMIFAMQILAFEVTLLFWGINIAYVTMVSVLMVPLCF